MQISSDLEEVDSQLKSSSEDFPRRKGSIQFCDFGSFQEGDNQKLRLADEDLGNRRGEGWQNTQSKGRRLLPGYNPGGLIQPSDPVQGLGSRRRKEDQTAPQARILRSRYGTLFRDYS